MTREELITMGISEENVEKIIADYGNAVQRANSERDKAKQSQEQVSALQKQLDEINGKNMSEIDKANAERDKALESVAGLEKEIEKMQIKNSFAEHGIVGEQADKLIESIGSGDFDVETLGQIISEKEKAAVAKKEKEDLTHTPNPTGSSGKADDKSDAEKIVEKMYQKESDKKDILSYYL